MAITAHFARGNRLGIAVERGQRRGSTPVAGYCWARLLYALLLVALPAAGQDYGKADQRDALVKQYCLPCHDTETQSGGLALEAVSTQNPAEHPDIWERVIRRLAAGEMPPRGLPRPDADAARAFSGALEAELDAAARRRPYAGRGVIRRLNRTEYANAVADLLAVRLPLER